MLPDILQRGDMPQNKLKKEAEDFLSRRNSNRNVISQFTPKQGEWNMLAGQNAARLKEQNKPLNRAASSKVAKNTMENLVEPLLALEGIGAIGGAAKALYKSGLKKAVKKEANDYASSLTQNNVTRYFDKEGKELPFTTAIRSKDEVIKANQALKKDFKTGSATTLPEELNPYLTDREGNKLGLSVKEENDIFLKNEKEQMQKDLPIMLNAQNVISDFRERISTPEGERRIKELFKFYDSKQNDVKRNLKTFRLTKDTNPDFAAYYQEGDYGDFIMRDRSGNPIKQSSKIGINPSRVDNSKVRNVTRHEIEHAVQSGDATEIDRMLEDLKLKPDDVLFQEDKNIAGSKLGIEKNTKAKQYFEYGNDGREKSAFLAELQQYLVDNKYISHPYAVDEITPSLLKKAYKENADKKDYALRVFNIMQPEESNYKLLANGLNKMLIGTGAIAGAKNILGQKNVKQ
jgi:hypothetical protein